MAALIPCPPRERGPGRGIFPTPRGPQSAPGFTLVELLVVMAIVSTLLALAVPRYFSSLERSRETALRHDLAVLREAIGHYQGDLGKYPDSLEDLVTRRYLRRIPEDPLTGRTDTWVAVPPGDSGKGGVLDVKSGAPGLGRDGTPYDRW